LPSLIKLELLILEKYYHPNITSVYVLLENVNYFNIASELLDEGIIESKFMADSLNEELYIL
jgi:hypothetical protein